MPTEPAQGKDGRPTITQARVTEWNADGRTRIDKWHQGTAAETVIEDPFAWLETYTPEDAAWTAEQQRKTDDFLSQVPGEVRADIRGGLERMYHRDEIETPYREGNRVFQLRRTADQNHKVLYVYEEGEDIDGVGRAVIDPNEMSPDGTVSVDWMYPSTDGRFVAYGTSQKGSEQSTMFIRDVETGKDLTDSIPHTSLSYVSWLPDGSGFYYMRLPDPQEIPQASEKYMRRAYFHKIGQDQREDQLVFETESVNHGSSYVYVSRDGQFALAGVLKGANDSDFYLTRLKGGRCVQEDFKPIFTTKGAQMRFVGFKDGYFYGSTNDGSPNYRVLRLPFVKLETSDDLSDLNQWEEVVAESGDKLESAKFAGDKLVLNYLHNASSKVVVFDGKTSDSTEMALPYIGTVDISASQDSDTLYYSIESFASPAEVHEFNISTGAQRAVQKKDQVINPEDIVVDQVTFRSKDGTPVTMFLAYRKGLKKDGDNRVILTGYGGFNHSMTPKFSEHLAAWIDRGGVVALPNLRGGGEYGQEWHEAGRLGNKQNVFDDFAAAAEYLTVEEYTRKEKLAAWGRSNGGLLTGAVLTQRPELFGAVISQVPLLDMVTYHNHKIAKLWRHEYGDPENPEHFLFLLAYSPYHNLRPEANYPPTIFVTGIEDSRVDPMHARKMAARMQDMHPEATVLIRTEMQGGHGAGKPVNLKIKEEADMYTFLEAVLGEKV